MGDWMKNLRQVDPYTPGEQPQSADVVKLNTNENPYPPAPGVAQALHGLDADLLRRYPAPDCGPLIAALAERYRVGTDQVFVGVGSDDVLAMSFMTFFNSEKPVLFPDITYSFYDVWANLLRIPYERVPLDGNLCLVKEDYYRENGGIVFPNPNAPTGILMPVSSVEDIAAHNPDSVVIVDEAYIDFGGESVLPLTEKYDNLLVVRTFSKSRALAGMRIGFALGSPALIRALNAVRNSYNSYTMSQAALATGVAAVADEAYFQEILGRIIRTRGEAAERLGRMGFSGPESAANFLFVTHESVPARELFEALRDADIYVRYFDAPRIGNYLRITVGTPEQMEKLYAFLEGYLGLDEE